MDVKQHVFLLIHGRVVFRVEELCESPGGRPGLPVSDESYGFCGRKATLNSNGNPAGVQLVL